MKKAVRECGSDGKPTHRDAALPNTEPRSLDCRAVPPRKPTDRPTILDSHPHPLLPSHPSHTYIPFHSPACLIRQHHQPLSGNAALLHPSGPQCSPTTYGSTLLPHSSRPFLPTFFLKLNRRNQEMGQEKYKARGVGPGRKGKMCMIGDRISGASIYICPICRRRVNEKRPIDSFTSRWLS
ncbi:hypothetical protein G5I_12422 [Acromyrmex echinatior]|uniref:Uncharacterized protein n=1 Tax=Acromyrmex echinatior TaxID=103372 RepID=F4X2A0_ACREC|nr:hypothetical protein G5I_12422 [Acromyrmex echinatior]